MNEEGMDRREALEAAVDRRKFLLNRLIKKPLLDEIDDDDDDDDDKLLALTRRFLFAVSFSFSATCS